MRRRLDRSYSARSRVGQEVDHHGRDVGPAGDAVALDQLAGGVAVPARQEHDGGAAVDRRVHAALHAGDVEHRQHREHDLVRHAAPTQCAPATVVYITLRWVCMQPLGWPVVPEVYGMHAQVVGAGQVRARAAAAPPARRARRSRRLARSGSRGAATKSGTGRSVGARQVVGIRRDDRMRQVACRPAARAAPNTSCAAIATVAPLSST